MVEPAADPGVVPASTAAGDQCHAGSEVSTTLQLALLGTAWKEALWKVPGPCRVWFVHQPSHRTQRSCRVQPLEACSLLRERAEAAAEDTALSPSSYCRSVDTICTSTGWDRLARQPKDIMKSLLPLSCTTGVPHTRKRRQNQPFQRPRSCSQSALAQLGSPHHPQQRMGLDMGLISPLGLISESATGFTHHPRSHPEPPGSVEDNRARACCPLPWGWARRVPTHPKFTPPVSAVHESYRDCPEPTT